MINGLKKRKKTYQEIAGSNPSHLSTQSWVFGENPCPFVGTAPEDVERGSTTQGKNRSWKFMRRMARLILVYFIFDMRLNRVGKRCGAVWQLHTSGQALPRLRYVAANDKRINLEGFMALQGLSL